MGAELDAEGCAILEGLLTPAECQETVALYARDELFRSTVIMARHGYGRGEYRYFAYPLPELVAELRSTLYPRLVPIANRWNGEMGIGIEFPAQHASFIERCHAAGQVRPTPLLLSVRGRRLQLPAPGPLRRARVPASAGHPAVGATGATSPAASS